MNRILKTLIVILPLLIAPVLHAQEAVIRDISGTVEYRTAGSDTWAPASRGQSLPMDAVISTSVRSTAIIEIGNVVLTVRPLTRLSILELSRTENTEKIELDLTAGRVRAEIISVEGASTDFTVRSSSATASVRGTEFEFDTINLIVSRGSVDFTALRGGGTYIIDAGRMSFADYTLDRAASPYEADLTELRPRLPIASIRVLPMITRPMITGYEQPSSTVDIDIMAGF
jgi:hypothetical protein